MCGGVNWSGPQGLALKWMVEWQVGGIYPGGAFSSAGIWPDSTLSGVLLAYFLVHGEMNKKFSSKTGHYWAYWAALKKIIF